MRTIRISAIADVHSPRFLNEFELALSRSNNPDVLLFAGDMINRGKSDEYANVLDAVESHLGTEVPIFACFGNEDPAVLSNEILAHTGNRITFLDDDAVTLRLAGSTVSVVGMSAVNPELASEPMTEIRTIFEERAVKLTQLLQNAQAADHIILLMHFNPLSDTEATEFSWWVSEALKQYPPDLVIHGHIHDSTRKQVEMGATTIWNVALPLTGTITELNL